MCVKLNDRQPKYLNTTLIFIVDRNLLVSTRG